MNRNCIIVMNPFTNTYYYWVFGYDVKNISTEKILRAMGLNQYLNEDAIYDMYECSREELMDWVTRLEKSNIWFCGN